MTWASVIQKCEDYGGGWRLLGPEDNKTMIMVNKGMKKRRWKSVWTGVKMKMFDGFYWEDGSLQSKKIIDIYRQVPVVVFKNVVSISCRQTSF